MADMKRISIKRKNLTLNCKDEVARNAIIKSVSGKGTVSCPCEDNTDYSYTGVTSFSMEVKPCRCHGFITFAAEISEIPNISGSFVTDGDDILEAAGGETWEFSVWGHNNKGYITWDKKGE